MSRYQPHNKKLIRTLKKNIVKFIKFIKKKFIVFLVNLVFLSLLIVGGYFGYKYWNNPKHDIKDIVLKFDEVADIYDKSDIEATLKNKFIGKNKILYKGKMILGKDINTQYGRVEKSNMTLSGEILYIDIIGKMPNFIIVKDHLISDIVSSKIYPTTKDLNYYKSGSGYRSKLVYIKSAGYTTTGFDGMFYNIGINSFVKQMEIITSALSDYKTISYMPGGKKVEIETHNGQLLYFDIGKNIVEQINKYKILKEKYNKFDKYKIIDLGTIEGRVFLK